MKQFCLTFDEGWNGLKTIPQDVYIDARDVVLEPGPFGLQYSGYFNGVSSVIEIPYFTNNQFSAFTISFVYLRVEQSDQTGL